MTFDVATMHNNKETNFKLILHLSADYVVKHTDLLSWYQWERKLLVRMVGGLKFWLSQTNNLHNWFSLLPSLTLSITRKAEWEVESYCQWRYLPVGQYYNIVMSTSRYSCWCDLKCCQDIKLKQTTPWAESHIYKPIAADVMDGLYRIAVPCHRTATMAESLSH